MGYHDSVWMRISIRWWCWDIWKSLKYTLIVLQDCSTVMLRSYELLNMAFPTSQLVNCVQLTSQLMITTYELEIFYAVPYSPLVKKWQKLVKSCKATFHNKLTNICLSWNHCSSRVVYIIIMPRIVKWTLSVYMVVFTSSKWEVYHIHQDRMTAA